MAVSRSSISLLIFCLFVCLFANLSIIEREAFTYLPQICGFAPGDMETFVLQEVMFSLLACFPLCPLPSAPLLPTSFFSHSLHSSASATSFAITALSQQLGKGKGALKTLPPHSLDLRAYELRWEEGETSLGCPLSHPFL